MSPQEESRFTNGNRAFLQAILARGCITFEESRPILASILNAEEGRSDIEPDAITEEIFISHMEDASEAASMFDFEIRITTHQITKKRIYALVNTTSDPQTQLATTYTPDELSFIKRILDAMFDKYNSPNSEVLAITEMQAIKFARPDRRQSEVDLETQALTQTPVDRGLKHSEVEAVLASLVEGGWFERSYGSYYSLSPRALLELRPWLIETYNDPDASPDEWQRIKFCEACKDIVTVGLRCNEPDCNFRLHEICENAFWRTRKDKKCPKCSTAWTGERYVGEKALNRSRHKHGGRSQGAATQQSRANETIAEDGSGEEAEEAETPEESEEENLYDDD